MKDYTINFGSPKKMILELSEDGTYYNTEFYQDVVDADGKMYEAIIELKVDVPAANNIFQVREIPEDDGQIFSIIVADEEQTSDSWGKCLGYTGTACPSCGRYRLELYENGKQVCEKCNWCVEDAAYVDVFAEEDEQMWGEYRKSYDICKEK